MRTARAVLRSPAFAAAVFLVNAAAALLLRAAGRERLAYQQLALGALLLLALLALRRRA